jgi:hypothetical protein
MTAPDIVDGENPTFAARQPSPPCPLLAAGLETGNGRPLSLHMGGATGAQFREEWAARYLRVSVPRPRQVRTEGRGRTFESCRAYGSKQAVFEGSKLRKTDALVVRTLPPPASEEAASRAQLEREAKAYWVD